MSSNNTANTSNTSNTKQLGQLRTDGKNVETYTYLIVVLVLGLILGLIYTNSRPYLVSKMNNKLYGIEKYLTVKSYDENMEEELKNFKIFSTTNPVNRYRLLGDYSSVSILKNILRLGVRYIELNVFAENFKYGSKPVVSNGYKTGQWKLMINSVDFEDCMKVIKENAFTDLTNINGSPNPKDPLFLGLNLHTGYNTETLDIVADIINFPKKNIKYDWRLNERHYGALQGLNKSETAEKYGEEQVLIWRRSYNISPPLLSENDKSHPKFNPKFKTINLQFRHRLYNQ